MTSDTIDMGSYTLQPNADSGPEVRQALARIRAKNTEQLAAIERANQGLLRLVDVMRHQTGQGYKLRGLLYSLWNGQPTSLLEIVTLDYELRKDLLAVLLVFGNNRFFYDQLDAPIKAAGLFDWFCEAEVKA